MVREKEPEAASGSFNGHRRSLTAMATAGDGGNDIEIL